MNFKIEITITLKKGMLNPEASTIEKSLELLGYEVNGVNTSEIIRFNMDSDNKDDVEEKVTDMCERLLCNPVIHDYKIEISE